MMLRRAVLLTALFASALAFAGQDEVFDKERFERHVAALCKALHRLSGTTEGAAAREYIQNELKSMGYDVQLQHFTVPQCESVECKLSVGGADYELFPMHPNLLQPAVTSAAGLTGKVIYAGSGTATEFDGVDPRGAIVLLDFSQLEGGSQAFALGAAAVVYVEDEHTFAMEACDKQVNITADLPRFFIRREVAQKAGLLTRGTVSATILSSARWTKGEGANVIAVLPGSTPAGAEEEALVLSCHFDTLGSVAALAQGARAAANCAALLETARIFKAAKPTRTVLFAFLDDECQYHLGSRWLYYAIQKVRIESANDAPLQTVRRKMYADEKTLLDEKLGMIRQEPPADAATFPLAFMNDAAIRELDLTASWQADRLVEPTGRLNKLIAKNQLENKPFKALSERVDKFRNEKSAWNKLRYALKSRIVAAEDMTAYKATRQLTEERLARRRAELDLQETRNDEYIALGNLLVKPPVPGKTDPVYVRIVAHFNFDFSDAMPYWGLIVGGDCPLDTANYGSTSGTYAKAFGAIRNAISKLRANADWPHDTFFDHTVSGLYSTRLWVPTTFTHAGEVAEAYGYFGFTLMTMGDGYSREGLPSDTIANLKIDVLRAQAGEGAALLRVLASDPEFGLRNSATINAKQYLFTLKDSVLSGNNVVMCTEGASITDEPAAGVIVAALPARKSAMNFSEYNYIPGFDRTLYMFTDSLGFFDMPSVVPNEWAFDAAKFDARGRVTYIVNHNEGGNRVCFANFANAPVKLKLFHAQGAALTLCRDTLTGNVIKESDWKLLNAETDADFPHYYIRAVDTTMAFYVPFGKSVKLFGKTLLPLIKGSPDNPMGTGVSWTPEDPDADPAYGSLVRPLLLSTALTASGDLWNLNESRLKRLRRAGLYDNSIERMHGFGEDQLAESKDAAAAGKWGSAYAHAEASAIAGNRIYNPIIATMDDVIHAVIFLLILTIPFAFSLERLLIGSPNIYRQIAGFAGFFLITFLALYAVHPAFQLAATPMIIFLAFTIIVMSGFVIMIVMQKFQSEIRTMQGLAGSVHTSEVSRMSTMLAAVQMGISTMRRRPLRTTLTAVTVVLLTFTILCFASFSSTSDVIHSYLGQQNNKNYMLIHNVTWSPIDRDQVSALKSLLSEEADVYARVSMSGGPFQPMQAPVMTRTSRSPMMLNGVMAVSEFDHRVTPEIFDALEGDTKKMLEGDGIFLSEDMLEKLKLKRGDSVTLWGYPYTVAGTFDNLKVEKIRQLDGSPYLPLDFQAAMEMSQSNDQNMSEDVLRAILQNIDPGSLTSISPAQVAFVSDKNMEKMKAWPRAIIVMPKKPEAAEAIARKVARLSDNYVYAGLPDGVHRFQFTDRVSFTGIGDLIVPLLLGGLIVFSTMLGSVVEREKEIFTFSALGLAPPHVATLFFAEVFIYAVLGGLGGYLLGQSLVTVLTFLSTHYGIVRVPNVNYSSSTAIITILIVMATVLLSTIYPAIKASRSANPGVNRSWKLPKPQGDIHSIVFPFTVSSYDMKGIVSFLKEHLDSHNDISLGHFSAQDAEILKIGDSRTLGLHAKVWLAPFDLGVSQTFKLSTVPSSIPGIQEVNIEFHRLSGRPANWERFNRIFINDLRKQFLIWRALNHDAMENYRAKTDEAIKSQISTRKAPVTAGDAQRV